MEYESDERLARRFSETGHGRALEILFRRHLPRIYALTRRYFPVREDAEEASSETFLRAFRALRERQYRGEAAFATWLARIAVNVCLERLRQPRLPALSFELLPSDLFSAAAPVVSPVQEALEKLPDDQRLALTLCDLEGYSALETAQILGRTVTATKSLHYRARRALRDAMTDPNARGQIMTCDDARELFGNYLDEELTDVLRSRLDAHVASCAVCREDLTSLRATLDALRETGTVEPPSAWFTERLLDRLARDSEAPLERQSVPASLQLDLW